MELNDVEDPFTLHHLGAHILKPPKRVSNLRVRFRHVPNPVKVPDIPGDSRERPNKVVKRR